MECAMRVHIGERFEQARRSTQRVAFDQSMSQAALDPHAADENRFIAACVRHAARNPSRMRVRGGGLARGWCTATVYTLCERGLLRHARVLNAIRVAPGEFVGVHPGQCVGGDDEEAATMHKTIERLERVQAARQPGSKASVKSAAR